MAPMQSPEPILETKGMAAILQKNGKEMLKKSKIFKNLGKNLQYLNIFWKKRWLHAMIACGDCMQETAIIDRFSKI